MSAGHVVALMALGLAGCAGISVAELEAPAALAAAPVQVLPAALGRIGSFSLDGRLPVQGQFQRSADRLSLFEAVDVDRAALSLDLNGNGSSYSYRCTLRRTGAQIAFLALPVQPMKFRCSDGGARQLQLDEQVRASRTERTGSYTDASLTLTIESLHRLQGSPLPLQQAGGYLLRYQGRPAAVVDLMDRTPRLRTGEHPAAVGQAIRDAALLLALHWDPER